MEWLQGQREGLEKEKMEIGPSLSKEEEPKLEKKRMEIEPLSSKDEEQEKPKTQLIKENNAHICSQRLSEYHTSVEETKKQLDCNPERIKDKLEEKIVKLGQKNIKKLKRYLECEVIVDNCPDDSSNSIAKAYYESVETHCLSDRVNKSSSELFDIVHYRRPKSFAEQIICSPGFECIREKLLYKRLGDIPITKKITKHIPTTVKGPEFTQMLYKIRALQINNQSQSELVRFKELLSEMPEKGSDREFLKLVTATLLLFKKYVDIKEKIRVAENLRLALINLQKDSDADQGFPSIDEMSQVYEKTAAELFSLRRHIDTPMEIFFLLFI